MVKKLEQYIPSSNDEDCVNVDYFNIEMDDIYSINEATGWSIAPEVIDKMWVDYKKAVNAIQTIEERLTDCNFHSKCSEFMQYRKDELYD